MKLLLITVFLISIIFFISIPDAFGGTYLVNVPMGAAGGVGNFEPNVITIEKVTQSSGLYSIEELIQ